MDQVINTLAALTVVLTFVGAVFSFFVLRPLYNAIAELRDTIKDLRKDVYANEQRRHALEIKVAEVDQSTRSAHHRIDTLSDRLLKE